ncbi:hypothetical protein KSX_80700 [Ktedonospora formicarum]|uniref:Uncharacterized protein n=1 Tax=Ktedonospora formicarum TaxID=2778364 RepID=A0A8J3I473_9CHLR|nr:hypothetical protein KSX_80700 [Ktedonospora formicarum]
MLHGQKSKRGEVFSDRLLVDYPYLLFARTLQVMMEAAKQTQRSDHQTKGDARTLSMSEKMGDGSLASIEVLLYSKNTPTK